jgi:hypothetical protein
MKESMGNLPQDKLHRRVFYRNTFHLVRRLVEDRLPIARVGRSTKLLVENASLSRISLLSGT